MHAIDRAASRYGLELKIGDLKRIAELIQTNHGSLVKIEADSRSIWWLTYRDTRLKLIMSPDLYHVITFLPPFDKKPKALIRKERKRKKRHRRPLYIGGEARYGAI